MKEQMMWVIGYLMLSGLPLMAAAVIVKQLIIGYGEPFQIGPAMTSHKVRTIKKHGG